MWPFACLVPKADWTVARREAGFAFSLRARTPGPAVGLGKSGSGHELIRGRTVADPAIARRARMSPADR